jgi:hypothetical protein
MKISKPKLTKCRASELWMCEGGYITYASTPEKAYNDWLVKEKAEPYHLYSKRSMKELMKRLDKRKKENPEMFEKKVYSGSPSAPEPPEHIDRGVTVGTWVPKWFSKLFGGSV